MAELAQNLPLNLNDIADVNRLEANGKLDQKLRGKLGQFMSSSAVSKLLANMFESLDGEHRLLDAGAGVGSLTAAFVDRVLPYAEKIDSTSYELSNVMNHYLADTLQNCADLSLSNNVQWEQEVLEDDFIEHSVSLLLDSNFKPKYNKAILNPPYLKIAAKGSERAALRKVGFETGNLYSAFVGLAIKQLENGES